MKGILKLTIELTEAGARRMNDMRMRLVGGKKFSDLVRNALIHYENLDEKMLPEDTLWIKRGNQFIQVDELNLPARPTHPHAHNAAMKATRLPPGWKIIADKDK